MYATFETRGADELATEPAFVEAFTMLRLGDDRATTLALWESTAEPQAYLVEQDRPGTAADRPAAAASVLWFDGPMSPPRVSAARFSFSERVAPALAAVPGLVRSLMLWHGRDASSCAVTLAVDVSALEAAGATVNATELLPGEDPALLTGPDRVEIHHTVARTVPAARTSVIEGADR